MEGLAKSRPFLRSAISAGFQQSAGLGTFFAGNSALQESSRQGKAIKAGEQKDFEIDKIVNDPINPKSSKLFIESDNKNELGEFTIYNSTLNNSNESLRRLQATAKKNMKEMNGK